MQSLQTMKQPPELWKVLLGFIPTIIAISSWLWYLSTKVERNDVRMDKVEQIQKDERVERKEVIIEIKNSQIRTEDKLDRLIQSKQVIN